MNRIIDVIKGLDLTKLYTVQVLIPQDKRDELHNLLISNKLVDEFNKLGKYYKYILKNSETKVETGVYSPCRFLGEPLYKTLFIYYGWNMLTSEQMSEFNDDIIPTLVYNHRKNYESYIIRIEI